jgi:trigger factor
MTVTVNPVDQHKITLHIEVPVEDVEKGAKQAYQRLANQVNIKGFRKGKAPAKVLDSYLGKEAVKEEIFSVVATKAYDQALQDEKIIPVTEPEVNVITHEDGQPIVFEATIIKKPEVVLGEYKGIDIAKEHKEVTDEEVATQLESIRQHHAKMVVAEGAVLEQGDFAIIDFAGSVDGKAFDGGEGKSYPLEIGSGSFIPGFEEQLIGTKAGEEVIVKVTFPADYHATELAGKEAEFKVTIQDVKRRELPPLNDEFAKENSAYETLTAMQEDLRKKLQTEADHRAQNEFNSSVIKEVADHSTVEVPDVMVEEKITQMIQELQMNLEGRKMNMADYLKYSGQDMAKLRESYLEPAKVNIKTDLVLEAIVKAENIQVTSEDLNMEIYFMAQNFGANPKDVWNIISKEKRVPMLASSVARKKAAAFIIKNTKGAEKNVLEEKTEETKA